MVTITLNNRHLGLAGAVVVIAGLFASSHPPSAIKEWWASSPSSFSSSSSSIVPTVDFDSSSSSSLPARPAPLINLHHPIKDQKLTDDEGRSGSIFVSHLKLQRTSSMDRMSNDSSNSTAGRKSITTSNSSSRRAKNHELNIRKEYNITFQDLAVVIITSSSTIEHRLPLLYEAWIKEATFPVIVLTDERNETNVWDQRMDIRRSPCSGKINGLICKTKMAFEIMHREFLEDRKWFLRLMDDTLVILPNLLHVLKRVDPEQPWCVGDKIPIRNANFSYFQGGGGWGLTAPTLRLLSHNWPVWDNLILAGGDSPISPGFTAVSPYADDLFWGIFMANLDVPALKLDGWSGAPMDIKGGLIPCDQELKKAFCFQQTFPVGTWADGTDVVSMGACRTNMTGIGVVHMGLEIWGGRDPWVEQIVNVSRAFAKLPPNDIVANFEDGPLFYWRLCSQSGKTIQAPNEALYTDIYRATKAKQRLWEEFQVLSKMKRVYIGLCQEPADVISILPESYHNDTMIKDVLRNALDRLRDHLRSHLRPAAFDLVAGEKKAQIVYRVGENAYQLAERVCKSLGMGNDKQCVDYAVINMQSKLPRHLHYDNLCLNTKAYVVDPNQFIEDSPSSKLPPGSPSSSSSSSISSSSSSSSSRPRSKSPTRQASVALAAAVSRPVSVLIEEERKDVIKKKGWRVSPLQASDIAIAILTTSEMIEERLAVVETAWLRASSIDVLVITDKGEKGGAAVYDLPYVEVVESCPKGEAGIGCKTAKAMELLAKRYPGKKWYLRLSDTALVFPENVIHHLQYFSPDTPRCVGELITTQGISVQYLHGGPGWALNQAGLKAIIDKLDHYRGIYTDPKTNIPFPFESVHTNLDDFYWGIFIQLFGVSISQAGGWSAVPLDMNTVDQSCQTLLRSGHFGRQGFHVGKTTQGLVVAQTSPRIVLDRPAVINMARQPESYTLSGAAWLDEMMEAGSLLQSDAANLAAGYEDEPYNYWRLCRVEGGQGKPRALSRQIVREIVCNAKRGVSREPFRLASHNTISAQIDLCQSADELVLPVCKAHGLNELACTALYSLVEFGRDQLRKRVPPAYFTVALDDYRNISAVYRVGEDPTQTAQGACEAAGLRAAAMDGGGEGGSGGDFETCLFAIESAANAAVPTALRFQSLCPAQAKRSPQAQQPAATTTTTASGAARQTKREVVVQTQEDVVEEEDKEEDGEDESLGPSHWAPKHLHLLRGYIMAGNIMLAVTTPQNGTIYRSPGAVPVQVVQTLLAPGDGRLNTILGRDIANIRDALSEIMLHCFALDQGPERCVSVYQYTYNMWVEQAGKHTLSYWGKDKATGERIRGTEGSMIFTSTPLKTLNPFAPYCSVPFTQRDLLFGRLQRMAEDHGRLTFDEPVAIPLQILYRLSPRAGLQQGELPSSSQESLSTVMASTMSLIKNLQGLSPEQRQVTTLRVYPNGFSEQTGLRWKQWFGKICRPLGLAEVIVDTACPTGNMPSYLYMKDQALRLKDNQTIVYLIEDDYLLQPTAIAETVEMFASHNPCIIIPYDGAERYGFRDYNEDDGQITLIAGRHRHWRTTRSTTVTLAMRVGTMRFIDCLGILMNPADDYFNSGRVVDEGASIVLPLPGLAAHVEQSETFTEPFVPLYFDYYAYARKLKKEAAREGLTYDYISR